MVNRKEGLGSGGRRRPERAQEATATKPRNTTKPINTTKPTNTTNNTNSRNTTNPTNTTNPSEASGLNVELHPFLRPAVTTDHVAPLKRNVRQAFDPTAINPYVNAEDITSVRKSRQKAFQFNPGRYIDQGNQWRQQLEAEREHQRQAQAMAAKGLVANEALGEHLYAGHRAPNVEWWDSFYVNGHTYDVIDQDNGVSFDTEAAPITNYIQHPVLLPASYAQHEPGAKPMFLTKKELKRSRRNQRQQAQALKQERIRKGLEAPPPPKVKLSNLMNVLTNEAIKDPTAVEHRVRTEVEQRVQQHIKENNDRKLTKDQKHAKIDAQHQKDKQAGYFSLVYKVDKLVHPQHWFKVDKNAQQMGLCGVCVVYNDMAMIYVEGGAKAIKQYRRLMNHRIDWSQQDVTNKCTTIWDGQIKDLKCQKWSVIKIRDEDNLEEVLERFNIGNYWRAMLGK